MTLDDIYLNLHSVDFSKLVCQTEIQTQQDKDTLYAKGHTFLLTEAELQEKVTLDPKCIWYTPCISPACIYWNPETMAVAPFHVEMFFLDEAMSKSSDKWMADAKKAIHLSEEDAQKGFFNRGIELLPSGMRFGYMKHLVETGNKVNDLYSLFRETYTDSDYGFGTLDEDFLRLVFEAKTEEQKEDTARKISALPETITVYRGGNSNSTPYTDAYSWTIDMNIANFFASRRGKEEGYIAIGQVRRDDVLECLIEDRNEKELLISPKDIAVSQVIPIHGLSFLQDVLPKVAPMYQEYKQKMEQIPFVMSSRVHGESHQSRVLLLCLIISEMLGVPASDRRVLANAAIYHDTCRTHDGEDPSHGAAAKVHYLAREGKNANELSAFLCEYHSLPDEDGLAAIRKSRKLSKHRTKAELLLKIFKDADALDRVRFDIRDLDITQLRMEVSLRLTLVARLCHEQLKD